MEFHEKVVNQKSEWPRRGYLVGRTCEGITLRVVYSDESGVGNIDKEPVTVVTAIVVNLDRDWEDVERELNNLRKDAPAAAIEGDRILKGKSIYSLLRKNAELEQQRDGALHPNARQIRDEAITLRQFLHRLFGVIVKYRIPIFYGAVDRKGLIEYQKQPTLSDTEKSATAYNLAFAECLARLDAAASTFTNERLLWIADRSDKQREPATKSELEYYRSATAENLELLFGEPNAEASRISVADTIYFGHSSDSIALQLADVCCSTVTNYLLEQFYDWTYSATSEYWLIRRQIMNHGAPIILK